DRDQWQTEVARRLQVIASQHAKAARVDRQRLGDSKFRTEVSHSGDTAQMRLAVQILREVGVSFEDALGVFGQSIGVIRRGLQGSNRVVRSGPRLGGQRLEQVK